MSVVDKIESAIARLTALKPHVAACPVFNYEATRHIARNVDLEHDCTFEDEYDCGWNRYETGPAFDTLIRTIDAQLAVLRGALSEIDDIDVDEHIYGDGRGMPGVRLLKVTPLGRAAVQLAQAINGEANNE